MHVLLKWWPSLDLSNFLLELFKCFVKVCQLLRHVLTVVSQSRLTHLFDPHLFLDKYTWIRFDGYVMMKSFTQYIKKWSSFFREVSCTAIWWWCVSNCVTYLESLYKDHSRYPYQAPCAQGRPHGPFGAELLLQKWRHPAGDFEN